MFSWISWNGEVKAGDVLTVLSVLVAILTFLYTRRSDRQERKSKYDDRARRAAGTVEARLERWREFALGFYSEIQPLLVKASQTVTAVESNGHERVSVKGVQQARDELYSGLWAARALHDSRTLQDQIELAYVEMYGYAPSTHREFRRTLQQLREIDETHFADPKVGLTSRLQDVLSSLPGRQLTSDDPAEVGQLLRQATYIVRNELEAEIGPVISRFVARLPVGERQSEGGSPMVVVRSSPGSGQTASLVTSTSAAHGRM